MKHLTSERMTLHAGGKQCTMVVSYYDDGSIEIKPPPGKLCDKETIWLQPMKNSEKIRVTQMDGREGPPV